VTRKRRAASALTFTPRTLPVPPFTSSRTARTSNGGRDLDDGSGSLPPVGTPPRRLATALATALGLAAILVLAAGEFYLASAHGYAGTSDKATLLLEGQAIAHGDWLLRGWSLPFDSFWTSDDLVSAVLVRIAGLSAPVMHLDSAILAALFLVVGVCAATTAAVGRAARLAAAATVVVLVALPAPTLEYYLVSGAYHVGTGIWVLLCFLALCRNPTRFGWGWALGVACLAMGMLGDLEAVAYGILPVLCAGLLAMRRQRDVRAGVPLVGAALVGGVCAEVLRLLAGASGSFAQRQGARAASFGQFLGNFRDLVLLSGKFLGAGRYYAGYGISDAAEVLHIVIGLLVLSAFAVALGWLACAMARGTTAALQAAVSPDGVEHTARGTPAPPWAMDDLLVLAVLGAAATFLVQGVNGAADARYMTVSTLFACVLCGRLAGRFWPAVAHFPAGAVRVVVSAALAMAIGAGAGMAEQLSSPGATQTTAELVTFLESHHLYSGIGDYWSASMTTVQSGGRVEIRPVDAIRGVLQPTSILETTDWYGTQLFQFVVYGDTIPLSVNLRMATVTFGQPAHVYVVGMYHVLVWPYPLELPKL
jgi:hypothetical protein